MLCAGAVRKKNVQNTMLKNLLDAVSMTSSPPRSEISSLSDCVFLNFFSAAHHLPSMPLATHLRLETVTIQTVSSERQIFS